MDPGLRRGTCEGARFRHPDFCRDDLYATIRTGTDFAASTWLTSA